MAAMSSSLSARPSGAGAPGDGTAALRVLDSRDLDAVLGLLAHDPVAHVFLTARVRAAGLEPWRLGGEMWGYVVDGVLESVCLAGANLVPAEASGPAVRAFAERARRQGRRCSSIVGPADEVLPLWELLEPVWGPAREVRAVQPLMATGYAPLVPADPGVRRVRPDELDVVLPACVAMFTEEVGVSPYAGDGGVAYRARVAELVGSGRAFARIDDGEVVFKAEVGAVTSEACQIQGVWVAPDRRGNRLAAPGMAAVVEQCLATVAPVVSLYVNDFNTPAVATYDRVGFSRVGTFATVLF
jgi:predicted GNAT family acetyltransferase